MAAMRHQADDTMVGSAQLSLALDRAVKELRKLDLVPQALLNVTVAFVCTVLLWITLLFGIKGRFSSAQSLLRRRILTKIGVAGWALKRSLSRRLSQSSPVKSA